MSVAAIIAVAVRSDGRHDIIGLGPGPSIVSSRSIRFLKGTVPTDSGGRPRLLVDLPQGLGSSGSRGRQAGDLRRPLKAEIRHFQDPRHDLAEVPRPLDEECRGSYRQRAADDVGSSTTASPSAGQPGGGASDLPASGRSAPARSTEAGQINGRGRARGAGVRDLPGPTPHQAAFDGWNRRDVPARSGCSSAVRPSSWRSVARRLEASPDRLFSCCRFEAAAHAPFLDGCERQAATTCA